LSPPQSPPAPPSFLAFNHLLQPCPAALVRGMFEGCKGAKRSTNPTNEGDANAGADSSDGCSVHGESAAAAPPVRKVLKARRPSSAQGGSVLGLAKAVAAAHAVAVLGGMVATLKPSAAAAASLPSSALQHSLTTAIAAPCRGVPNSAVHPSLYVSFFDRYLAKHMRVPFYKLGQVVLPCRLVHAVLCFRAQRMGQPLPDAPDYMQLEITPPQLQRFLRGCVPSLARALVAPPASVLHLVPSRTKGRWADRIFIRVIIGLLARAEVRMLQGAMCAVCCVLCAVCSRAFLLKASARMLFGHCCIHAVRSKRCMAFGCDAVAGDAQASAALLNAALPRTCAPCR
jgi:hypothetical protein